MEFVVRKTPGVTYTLTIPAGIRSTSGDRTTKPATFAFTTSAAPKPWAPIASAKGQPYRYGVLEHPFPTSLTGPTAARQIALLHTLGIGFVRIDYCGAQSENVSNTFDFTIEDSIAQRLAKVGITELPIVDQYCAPAWANGGSNNGVNIWSTPALYAQFAGGVAAHLAANFPKVTRVELFNEPNLRGWWLAPPPYDDATGYATAKYMAAAYAAIKAAAPNLTVVGPALSDGGGGTDPRTFLSHMVAAGCGTGVCWDVLSVHDYAWMNPLYATAAYSGTWGPNRFDIYKDLQRIAPCEPLGRGPVPGRIPHVMLTEWGYSTAQFPEGFDPAVQALYLSIGADMMLADPTVDGFVWPCIYAAPGLDFWSGMCPDEPGFFDPARLHDAATFRNVLRMRCRPLQKRHLSRRGHISRAGAFPQKS